MDLSSKSGVNAIALAFMTQASIMAFTVFVIVRYDGRLQLLALGAALTQIGSLSTTAGVILTGHSLSDRANPADLPPGSTQQTIDTVKTGPLDPNA